MTLVDYPIAADFFSSYSVYPLFSTLAARVAVKASFLDALRIESLKVQNVRDIRYFGRALGPLHDKVS